MQNQTLFQYLKSCNDNILWDIFTATIDELNRRKTEESKQDARLNKQVQLLER